MYAKVHINMSGGKINSCCLLCKIPLTHPTPFVLRTGMCVVCREECIITFEASCFCLADDKTGKNKKLWCYSKTAWFDLPSLVHKLEIPGFWCTNCPRPPHLNFYLFWFSYCKMLFVLQVVLFQLLCRRLSTEWLTFIHSSSWTS